MKESVYCYLDTDQSTGPVQFWVAEYRAHYDTPGGDPDGIVGWNQMDPSEEILAEDHTHQGGMVRKCRDWAVGSGFKPGPARLLEHQTGFEMKLTRP